MSTPAPRRNATAAATLACVCVAAAVSCSGPLPFMSGGALPGDVSEPPVRWNFEEPYAMCQLETDPANPYSVNLAYTQIDGALYVYAGDTETEWVKRMEADPRVRFRVGDALYELEAVRVEGGAEFEAFAKTWASSSFFHRDPLELERNWLYRLVPRSS